jgi:uncharacterized oxidoreductase
MKTQGNTIFITGGSSGIGRGLAEALHQRGNQVIISGRREDRLQQICSLHPGMSYYRLDVTDSQAIQAVARQVIADFPAVNVVFNNSGVRMPVSFAPGCPLDEPALEAEISTNLFGPIRVASAFLSHLFTQTDAMLVNVSSAFAFVPRARYPVYCATKAAVHVWTLSLRHQLRDSGVKVVELIPPGVTTELGGPGKPANPASKGISVEEFVAQTLRDLDAGLEEIVVGDAIRQVAATSPEAVKKVFYAMNG